MSTKVEFEEKSSLNEITPNSVDDKLLYRVFLDMAKGAERDNPDFSEVIDVCYEYLHYLNGKSKAKKEEIKEFIFEEAIKATFGESIFEDYINKKL